MNRKNFIFVPSLKSFNDEKLLTDEHLIKQWVISEDDWTYIDSRILPILEKDDENE